MERTTLLGTKLRPSKTTVRTSSGAPYYRYHLSLKKTTASTSGVAKTCTCTGSTEDQYRHEYKLRSTRALPTSEELGSTAVFCQYDTTGSHTEVGGTLYALHPSRDGSTGATQGSDRPYCAQQLCSPGELPSVVLDRSETAGFVPVPLGAYRVLVQPDYRESDSRDCSTGRSKCELRAARQEWDYEGPCLHCRYVLTKSQTSAPRGRCCADGKPVGREPPQELLYYCRFGESDTPSANSSTHGNLLPPGSLGPGRVRDSSHTKAQGGPVAVQGRTYLLRRGESSTEALAFCTSGLQYGDEQDRTTEDVEGAAGPRSTSGSSTEDCSVRTRHPSRLGHEQYYENCLAEECAGTAEGTQHLAYEEPRVDVAGTPTSVRGASHYRANDRGDPCTRATLKSSGRSSVASAAGPYYEAVAGPTS